MDEKRNKVIIADKDIKTYAWDCLILFRKFDQIIISTSEPYKEKTNYIIDTLSALGVLVHKNYQNSSEKRCYKEKEVEMVDDKGRNRTRIFFEIMLTKDPNLYMYTNPDDKIK